MRLKLFVVLLLALTIYSQTTRVLEGFISDELSGERIESAIIETDGIGIAITDSVGFFTSFLKSSKLNLTVKALGYLATNQTITFDYDEFSKTIFISLRPSPIEIDEITITGTQFSEKDNYKTFELQQGEIKSIPVLLESDVTKAIQALPGVTFSHDFSNNIFLRGGNFDETLILYDGVPLYNSSHLIGIFSNFNTDFIKRAILYPSNYPVQFGGVLSGVLDIESISGNREITEIKGGVSLVSSRIYASVPVADLTIQVSGRRTYLDLITKLIGDLDYYFYDLHTKITYPINQHHLLSLYGFYSRDIYNIFSGKNILYKNEDLNWGNSFLKGTYIYSDNNFSIDIQGYYSNSSSRGDGAVQDYYLVPTPGGDDEKVFLDPEHLKIDNSIASYSIQANSNLTFQGQEIKLGIGFNKTRTNYYWDIDEKDISSTIDGNIENMFFDFAPSIFSMKDQQNEEVYFYLSDKLILTPRLSTILGYRGTMYSEFKGIVHSPYFKINYKVTPNTELTFSIGKYYQNFFTKRDLLNSTLFSPYSIYFFSKSKEELATSYHYSLGLNLEDILGMFRLESEVYYKSRLNTPVTNIHKKTTEFVPGNTIGLDILLKKDFGPINGWISYSYLRGVNNEAEYDSYINTDRTHTVKFVTNFKFWESWRFSAFWTYSTGLPYTPAIGRYLVGVDSQRMKWELAYGKKNSVRYADYHRLDIGVSKMFKWGSLITQLYVQVFNIYNSKNPFDYNPNASDTSYEDGGDKTSFPIPTFGITVEF